MSQLQKMSVLVTYYSLVSFLYFVCLTLLSSQLNYEVTVFQSIHIVIFTLFTVIALWKRVYSHPFHYYLHKLKRTISFNILGAAIIAFLITMVIVTVYINKEVSFNKTFILMEVMLLTLFYIIIHFIHYLWIKHLGNLGYFKRRVLIIGEPDSRLNVDSYFEDPWKSRIYSGKIVKNQSEWYYTNGKTMDEIANLESFILKENIGEVLFFINEKLSREEIFQSIDFLRTNHIPYKLIADISPLKKEKFWKSGLKNLPVIEVFNVRRNSIFWISVKRLCDLVLAFTGLIAGLPFWILISLGIFLYDRGPVLYAGTRIGKNGRPFKFYKFRSMILNADKLKEKLMEFNERQDGPLFKMANDPRITPLGRILRKLSLDEFPQLLNIIKGDMGFIGPRPHLAEEVAHYTPRDYLRLECIPGLSCLPQLKDRNAIGFQEWIELDLIYRKEWSVALDIEIFFKTLIVAFAPLFNKKGGM